MLWYVRKLRVISKIKFGAPTADLRMANLVLNWYLVLKSMVHNGELDFDEATNQERCPLLAHWSLHSWTLTKPWIRIKVYYHGHCRCPVVKRGRDPINHEAQPNSGRTLQFIKLKINAYNGYFTVGASSADSPGHKWNYLGSPLSLYLDGCTSYMNCVLQNRLLTRFLRALYDGLVILIIDEVIGNWTICNSLY